MTGLSYLNVVFMNCYQEIRIVEVLNKHTGRVNTVQWVHKQDCSKSFTVVNKCYFWLFTDISV